MDRDQSRFSLTERIRQAGKTLGVSHDEIAKELAQLSSANDPSGARELFDAYFTWELREMKQTPEAPDETYARSLRNFDLMAMVADNLRLTDGAMFASMSMAVEQPDKSVGVITRFFRQAVNYNPSSVNIRQ